MPEIFHLQASENNDDNYDRRQSPTFANTDRHTPMSYENSYEKKPEVYHIRAKDDHEPTYDERPFKSSSPPLDNTYPSSRNGPELYHLQVRDNDNNIHNHRSPPATISNNRVSPTPYQNSDGQRPEMYYLRTTDENSRQLPYTTDSYQKPKFNDDTTHHNNDGQTKATMYLLTANDENNQENIPPSRLQRTPSPPPPVRPSKKQQPFTYDIVDENNKYDVPNKQRAFPTSLHDVPSNVRYVPLSQSKATESIQRSMNKYRFGGN